MIQVVCMMGQSILTAANTWLSALFLNRIYEADFGTGMLCLCAVWAVFAVSELADSMFYSSMIRMDSKVEMQMRMELVEKGAHLSLIRYEDAQIRNRLKRAQDCMEQGWLSDLSLSVFNMLSEILKVAGILFVLAGFSPVLAGVSLLSVLPYFIVRMVRGKEFYELKKYQTGSERRRKYLYRLFGDKRAVKELRIFRIEEYMEQKLYETRDRMNDQLWKWKRRDFRSLFACELFCKSGYVCSIAIAVFLLLEQKLDFGMLAASLTAFSTFQTAAKYFLINLGRIPECRAFVKDYYDFMDLEEETRGREAWNPDFGEIQVRELCFSYPCAKKPALDHVSFRIKRGETVAMVGENGSGKTTLAKLLTGLYQAESGSIFFGTQDIRELDLDDFYRHISIVSQDFIKYELSVRENIAVSDWREMGNTDKIRRTLEAVGLGELASEGGLEEMLGTEFGGRELSVGQWQRAAIARGLFKSSSLIILDEPTAALDPVMETEVFHMFLEMAREKTAVIISHRIGICREADKIIVMKDGRAVEVGDHEELMEKRGEYYRMYMLQAVSIGFRNCKEIT